MTRLIDADKMLKRIESWNTSDAMDKALYNFTLNRIVEQPTVDAVPVRHGKWIPWKYHNGFRCEFCNEPVDNKHNYCPNCGAKMDAEREEE